MRTERGFALILVLILMGLGGLTITPALSLADTALRSRGVFAKDILNDYAADSAIEYSMWQLKWQPGFAASLPVGVESPPICITVNGVNVCTTIVAQAPADQLSGQPLAGPANDNFFKVTKAVLPSTAQPDVLTEFTYYVTIQCMDPNGCTDVTPYNQALERIEDCLPPGLSYVSGSVDLYPTLFSDNFERSDSNTVSGWTDSDGGGSNARISNTEVRLRLGASITKSAISTVGYTSNFITYIWRGDADAEVTDTLVVEWKPSASGTWTTLATYPLTTTSWQNASFTLPASADNTTIDIRFTANTDVSDEEARLDDVMVRNSVPQGVSLWDIDEWGVAPFEPQIAYGAGNCDDQRLRWDFNDQGLPDIAFDYGQTRQMGFRASGTLAEGVYCNRISVRPDNNNMRPGGTAKITVGDPAETRCSGGLLEVGKTSDTPVIYPNIETTITYTIVIKNVDTIPIQIRRVEDWLPTTGMADPTFVYVANSTHAFVDRASFPLLYLDNFEQAGDATPNTVPYWTDGDGGGSNCAIRSSGGDEYANLKGCTITESNLNTTGYSNIHLTYQWMGEHTFFFTDDFNRSNSNTVGFEDNPLQPAWAESESNSSYCAINSNYGRLRSGCVITQSSISTLGFSGIILKYTWRGQNAESTDTLTVQWKPSSSGTWNTLATHLLNNTSWTPQSYALPASADNTTIDIRFTGTTNTTDEDGDVDDVRVDAYRFADDFNRSNSDTVGNGWSESESNSSYCAINSNYGRFRSGCVVTQSSISTVGFSGIVLTYTWRGNNTESTDTLTVQWKPSSSGTWNTLTTHQLNNTSWTPQSYALPASADNTTIDIRLTGTTNSSDEDADVDDMRVDANIPSLTVQWKPSSSGTWNTLATHNLSVTSWQTASYNLPASADNTTIDIRYSGPGVAAYWARVDDVKVTSGIGTVAFDGFESGDGTGGTGPWNGNWTLSGDYSANDTSGEYQGTYHLRLRSSTGYAQRSVNLTGYPLPYLRFWARLNSFETSETAAVKVSTNGTDWNTLRTFIDGEDDNTYHFYQFDLSSYGSPATFYVAFDANMGNDQDYFYIDNVEFFDYTSVMFNTPICMPDQNDGTDFLDQNWWGSPTFRWELEWEFDPYYPSETDIVWSRGGLCGMAGVAGGALRSQGGYEWADYNPMELQPGETLTIVFKAVVTLTASGSYYNEVFVILADDINGTDTLYSWPVAGVTVPQYDMQATSLMSILRANASLTGDGVWKRSQHWKKHR